MSWPFVLLLLLVLLILFWSAYHWYSTGELPDAWAYRLYQSSKRSLLPPVRPPLELLAQTQGHELDAAASAALEGALREEQAFHAAELQALPWQPPTAAAAIVNSWVLANLYHYHVQPNTPAQAPAARQLAADYYERTLERIRRHPAGALLAPVAPERILERALGPVDPQEQAALLEQIRLQRLRDQPDYFAPRPVAADPQNVHDTEVQHSSARVMGRIRELNSAQTEADVTEDALLRELKVAVEGHPKREAALFTLHRMDNAHVITSLELPERRVLAEAWRRTTAPANEKNRPALTDALVDALADGAILDAAGRPSSTVCASGRCNRVLGAFTLLDADPVVAAPVKTVEILRNEILSKAQRLLETSLRERNLFDEYERGGESPDLQRTLDEVREAIRALPADYPDAKPESLDKIIDDALTGIA